VAGWPVPSAGQKIPLQPGWYLPPQKIPVVENRFLLAGKGAENTKEKFRHCFPLGEGWSICRLREWQRENQPKFPSLRAI